MASEEFYDREIAPALMAIAQKCEDHGISLVAKVEWEPGESGTTAAVRADASFALQLAHWAAASHGNVDALVMQCMRYGQEHGHSSLCLKQLGVPLSKAESG